MLENTDRQTIAVQACQALCAAYDRATLATSITGIRAFVNWVDIDAAHKLALQALGRVIRPDET